MAAVLMQPIAMTTKQASLELSKQRKYETLHALSYYRIYVAGQVNVYKILVLYGLRLNVYNDL
jgi:hypothetical protein